jgi:hypothetical protein
VRLLYRRQWNKDRVLNLFFVLDWLLRLPDDLEQQIRYEIQAIEEEEKMRWHMVFICPVQTLMSDMLCFLYIKYRGAR